MSLSAKKLTVPIQKLVPSIVTMFALCLGVTSIRYSLDGKFNIAVALIAIAAFLDGVDGRIARLLDSTSEFGAQLDSLADVCSFGVAPSITIYLWSLKEIPYRGIGWTVVLFYITCSTLRLARFNVQISSSSKNKGSGNSNEFFMGLPMPIAAGLLLIPLMCTFELLGKSIFPFSYWYMAFYMMTIGFLMVSKLPIYSAKKINIPREKVNIVLVIMGMIFTGVILEPWILLPIIGILYVLFIPVGIYLFYKERRLDNAN